MKYLILLFCLISTQALAAPTTANGRIYALAGGHDDGSFSLVLRKVLWPFTELEAENPAGCTHTSAYFFPKNAAGAELVALRIATAAVISGKQVGLVVRDDICYLSNAQDLPAGSTFPVIQRIWVR